MALEAPPASSPAVHNVMMANTSKDTKPELMVRRMLREADYPGYRIHWRIDDERGRYVCRPDITYPGRLIAVFVHGCFWHRCPQCELDLPKTNVDYWAQKFSKNVDRDRRKQNALLDMGWNVHTIWECDIGGGVDGLIETLSPNQST